MAEKNETGGQWAQVKNFLEAVKDDPRINVFHISVFISLVHHREIKNFENPMAVFSHEIIAAAKISSPSTYHKCIRALHEYGYIKYIPSCSNVLGSLVHFK